MVEEHIGLQVGEILPAEGCPGCCAPGQAALSPSVKIILGFIAFFSLQKTIGKIATCLELQSAALQSTQSQEEFKLEDLKKLEPILKNILTYNKEFPFDVQPSPLRRILAPGEEEHLEFEEDEEEGGAGAGSPNFFPARVPDLNGIDLTPVQDTPVASRKEDTYVHFNVDIELQKHIEKLTKGAAIFFEFKHYKLKKKVYQHQVFCFHGDG
ncbi:axin interactor, dorsalization-associated protein-like [Ictidomys tridecemlineatus]